MVAPLALALVVAASMCTAAISSLEGSAVIADYVFRFRSISGGYASLQWLSRTLSTSRGRLAECTNRLQLTALIRESPRVDVSRPSRCSCRHSAACERTGLSSSSRKASQIVRRASWRRPAKRPHRCVRSSPHGRQNSPVWLKAGKWRNSWGAEFKPYPQ